VTRDDITVQRATLRMTVVSVKKTFMPMGVLSGPGVADGIVRAA